MPIVVGFTGRISAGKDFTARFVAERFRARAIRTTIVSSSHCLREILTVLGLAVDRKNLQYLSGILWQGYGPAAISNAVARILDRTDADLVLWTGLRTLEDLSVLRRRRENMLVGVLAASEMRYARTCQRLREVGEREVSLQEFEQDDTCNTEENIDLLVSRADLKLHNEGDIATAASLVVARVEQLSEVGTRGRK
jgi:dephospho-CoA kinase